MSLAWSHFILVIGILMNKKMNGLSGQFGKSMQSKKRITTKSYKKVYLDVVSILENFSALSLKLRRRESMYWLGVFSMDIHIYTIALSIK